MKRLGRPPHPRRDEAVALYRDGMLSGDVARRVGCSPTSVVQWARAAGVPVHGRGRPRGPSPRQSKRAAQMRALYVAGETYRQIGERFGCTGENVRAALARCFPGDEAIAAARAEHLRTAARAAAAAARAATRVLDPKARARASAMLRTGSSTRAVRQATGLRRCQVERLWREGGFSGARAAARAERDAEAVRLYRSGLGYNRAAKRLGVTAQTVKRAVLDAGVTPRSTREGTRLRHKIDAERRAAS